MTTQPNLCRLCYSEKFVLDFPPHGSLCKICRRAVLGIKTTVYQSPSLKKQKDLAALQTPEAVTDSRKAASDESRPT